MVIRKQWPNGSTIRIKLIDGTQEQKNMVQRIAPEWTKHANLSFEFTDDTDAEIRVTFNPNAGNWSFEGTNSLNISGDVATMNFSKLDQGVILHQFGHMIGLGHEFQVPEGGIYWNEKAIIEELSGPPNFWTIEIIRHFIINKYSHNQINGPEFDQESIMLYSFPTNWTLDGFHNEQNTGLSEKDKAFVASEMMYPKDTD